MGLLGARHTQGLYASHPMLARGVWLETFLHVQLVGGQLHGCCACCKKISKGFAAASAGFGA